MLSFNHPRPVNSNKPVAVLVQQQDDDKVLHVPVGTAQAEPPLAATAPVPLSELHFFVRYTLGEYISFMWQHGGYLIRRRRIRFPASLYLRLKSTSSCSAADAAPTNSPSTSMASCAPAAA